MTDTLFPLRLTLWEELFLVDDFVNYPANFQTRISCHGRLSYDVFYEAVRNCTQSHPLFQCRVEKHGRKLYWVRADNDDLPIKYETVESELIIPLMSQFDVNAGRLWRIRYVEWEDDRGEPRTEILVEIHHTLCDGLGAIQFISDVAKEVHDLVNASLNSGSSQTPLRNADTDIARLKVRGQFPQTWKEFFRGLPNHYKTIVASMRLIFTKVAPLVPVESVRNLLDIKKSKLGYRKIKFTSTDSSKLRRTCRKQDSTVNSRVAAELFRAVLGWKIANGHTTPKALRIVMPFNERSLSDSRLPACNRVSVSPFTRKRNEIEDAQFLLNSIEQGVRVVKKGRLGQNFHRGLWFCKTFFRSLKPLAKTDRIGTTAMFSNVGSIDAYLGLPFVENGVQCGPLTITDIDVVPPLRVGTSFAITMHDFRSETRLGIHYDSSTISCDQADSFFELLRERILGINSDSAE